MAFEIRDRYPAGAQLGEAPLWLPAHGVFLWLDLLGREVHRFDSKRGEDRVIAGGFDENLACLARLSDGGVLLVTATGFLRLEPESGVTVPLPAPLRLAEGTCFNDGKVAPDGALWLGVSDVEEVEATGSLHRVSASGVECVDRGFVIANGPAFSPDGRLAYFADSVGGRILRYALDAGGEPTGRALFAEVPEGAGVPDGMTTDREGRLHCAHWGGARISVYDPRGRIVEVITLPPDNVTSCAFGGDDCSLLFVTSAAREGSIGAQAPHGDVFLLSGGTKGAPEPEFEPTLLEVEPVFADAPRRTGGRAPG